METSCVLKHNVDELLVGVTKQVLLRKEESSIGGNSRNGNQSRVNLFLVIYMVLIITSGSKEWPLFISENLDESQSCPDEYVRLHKILKTRVM